MTKNTNKGVVFFAKNNEQLNYINQAEISARFVKHWLNVPVAIVCCEDEKHLVSDIFDHVIISEFEKHNGRFIYDGNNKHFVTYYNDNRTNIYDLTPFDETILMDTDYIVQNNILNELWGSNYDFMINTSATDLELKEEFADINLNDGGPPVFWATVVYFRKNDFTKRFFEMVKHVQKYHEFYFRSYQISNMMYRNDFAYSIAYNLIHDNANILPINLPVKQVNVPMSCSIANVEFDSLDISLNHDNHIIKTRKRNLHLMNKFDLDRNYDKFMELFNE